MKFKKRLRGVSNGQMTDDALTDLIRVLSCETIAVAEGGRTSWAPIVSHWELKNGDFDIEFSEQGLALMEATQDKRAELVQVLFEHITTTVH